MQPDTAWPVLRSMNQTVRKWLTIDVPSGGVVRCAWLRRQVDVVDAGRGLRVRITDVPPAGCVVAEHAMRRSGWDVTRGTRDRVHRLIRHGDVEFGARWKGAEKRYSSFRPTRLAVGGMGGSSLAAGEDPELAGAFAAEDERAHWELLISDGGHLVSIDMQAAGGDLPEGQWEVVIASMRVV